MTSHQRTGSYFVRKIGLQIRQRTGTCMTSPRPRTWRRSCKWLERNSQHLQSTNSSLSWLTACVCSYPVVSVNLTTRMYVLVNGLSSPLSQNVPVKPSLQRHRKPAATPAVTSAGTPAHVPPFKHSTPAHWSITESNTDKVPLPL